MKEKIQFSKILTGAFAAVMLPFSAYVVVRCLDLEKRVTSLEEKMAIYHHGGNV